MAEIERLTEALLAQFHPGVLRSDYGWEHPSLNVLDSLISSKRGYHANDLFVTSRVQHFSQRHPTITSLTELCTLLNSYETPTAFGLHELDYPHAKRLETLPHILDCLLAVQADRPGTTEVVRLAEWARAARPCDSRSMEVTEFGLAGFQYLRMLFGAQAARPNSYLWRFVTQTLGRRSLDPRTVLEMVEQAAKQAELPLRLIDWARWPL